jgi:hypothetical protein
MKRTPPDVLREGIAVFAERAETHGDFRTGWTDVALGWTNYTGATISPRDALNMMAIMKIVRDKHGGPVFDNLLDASVYLAMAATFE